MLAKQLGNNNEQSAAIAKNAADWAQDSGLGCEGNNIRKAFGESRDMEKGRWVKMFEDLWRIKLEAPPPPTPPHPPAMKAGEIAVLAAPAAAPGDAADGGGGVDVSDVSGEQWPCLSAVSVYPYFLRALPVV